MCNARVRQPRALRSDLCVMQRGGDIGIAMTGCVKHNEQAHARLRACHRVRSLLHCRASTNDTRTRGGVLPPLLVFFIKRCIWGKTLRYFQENHLLCAGAGTAEWVNRMA